MMMINFENRAHWNMFTADKKELIDVYNNIVERFNLNEENYFLQPDVEIKITVNKNGVLLLWYYPKEIEEENRNCDKTFFQYKIDLYKDDSIPHPRFIIYYDEPSFYPNSEDIGETIVVKNKKLNMTITHRNSVYENADDAYKAFVNWHDKVRKDALKARIEAI